GIRLWNTEDWCEQGPLPGHGAQPCCGLAFFPDGKTLVSADQDGSIRLWTVKNHGAPKALAINIADLTHMALSPDGKRIAVVEKYSWFHLLDVSTGKGIRRHTAGEYHAWAAFSPDGRALAVSCPRAGVQLWDAETGKELRRWADPVVVTHIAFSPDGK